MKNRKFLSLLLACMMVLSLLTSCGGQQTTPPEQSEPDVEEVTGLVIAEQGMFSSGGGLVGILHGGLIENCRVYGTVTAIPAGGFYQNEMPRFIGGMMGHSVVGRVDNSYASCYVLTSVPSGCVGGFSGLVEGGDIVRCTIDGKKLGGWEIIDDYHRTEPQIEIKK